MKQHEHNSECISYCFDNFRSNTDGHYGMGRNEEKVNHEEVANMINNLVSEYDFPIEILQDINQRLSDCQDPHYAAQQLRYLQNIVNAGKVKKKGGAS